MSGQGPGRDERLGAAIGQLPVAPPGPGFEARVTEALHAEAAAMRDRRQGGPRRRGLRPGLWVGAAATVMAVLAVSVGFPGGQPAAAVTLGEVQGRVDQAVAGLRTLQGEITVSGHFLPGARPDEVREFSFAMTAEGDFRVTSRDGDDDLSYDARAGLQRSVVADPASGALIVAEARGLAPGRPDAAPQPSLLDRSLGSFVRTFLAIEGGAAVRSTTVDGRPAWRVVVPAGVGPQRVPTATMDVTVDQATGLPIRTVRTSAGRVTGELVLRRLVVDAPVDRATFRLELPEQSRPSSIDVGFAPVDEAGVEAVVGYRPLLPVAVPEGFARTHLAVARVAAGTGLANPLSSNVVSVAYQRGFDRIVVTTRDAGGDAARWGDPLAETPVADRSDTRRLGDGALAGHDATVVVDRAGAHLWAVAGDLVVTVAGDLSPDQLVAVAESLEAR